MGIRDLYIDVGLFNISFDKGNRRFITYSITIMPVILTLNDHEDFRSLLEITHWTADNTWRICVLFIYLVNRRK